MLRLVRSRQRERIGGWGLASSSTAPDVACPCNDNLIFENWTLHLSYLKCMHQTMDQRHCWNVCIRLWTGDTADEVGAEPARATDSESDGEQFWYPSWSVLFSFLGEADVRAELFGSLLPYRYRNEIIIICIFSVLLCIRSLLNNEPFTTANPILNLFADVLNQSDQSRSDVCGLTDIHKSTYKSDQPHCGDLAPHTPTLLSTS